MSCQQFEKSIGQIAIAFGLLVLALSIFHLSFSINRNGRYQVVGNTIFDTRTGRLDSFLNAPHIWVK